MANQRKPTPYNSPFEVQYHEGRAQEWIIRDLIRKVHTAAPVRVLAVRSVTDRVGFVDVVPLIEDVDTNGAVIEQAPIYNVPFLRLQGGASAVILDPAVGDIGLAVFAERDATALATTLQAGPAATARSHSSADGFYFGGFLNGAPTQWVKFLAGAAGIDIHTPGDLTLSSGGAITLSSGGATTVNAGGGFVVNANMTLNGTMSGTHTGPGAYQFAGTIVAPEAVINNVTQSTHVHSDPQGGDTGGPHN